MGLVEVDEVRVRSIRRADEGHGGLYQTQLRCKDGAKRWVEYSQQILDDNLVLTIVRDISDRKRLERRLRLLADTDSLTGIYNRRRFEEEVERQVRSSRRFGDPITLVLIDLDGMKAINDQYGHPTGDNVLRKVAHTLQEAVRQTDAVGRIGGDEFAVLLTRAKPGGAERVVEDFRRRLRITSARLGVTIHASVGIATARGAAAEYATLLRSADHAMYADKK